MSPAPAVAPEMHAFADARAAGRALAERAAATLRRALADRGAALLIVAGGRTPVAFFNALASAALDWSRVAITLADERWVGADDAASNARLVRTHLLQGAAAAANFVPLKTAAPTPAAAAAERSVALAPWLAGADLAVLGVGDDGHFASLFPRAHGVERALDAQAPPGLVAIDPPAAPHPRLSLNLAALLAAREIVLLIEGEAKRQVLARALEPGNSAPIGALLRQRHSPLDVYWSPDGAAP